MNRPVTFRAHCPKCPWTGRSYSKYGDADTAARDHAREHGHRTWVLDHYDLKVIGSTVDPADPGR